MNPSERLVQGQFLNLLISEWRGKRAERRSFYVELKKNTDPTKGWDGLPQRQAKIAEELSNFFDLVGMLYFHGFIDEGLVLDYFGLAITRAGDRLGPFIKGQREILKQRHNAEVAYQVYFEHLCKEVKEKYKLDRYKGLGKYF